MIATPFFRNCLLAVLFIFSTTTSWGQSHNLEVGLRFQKSFGWYNENGFSINFSHKDLLTQKLYFGAAFVSSRLGSAIGSNAIKQDNYIVYCSWSFREQKKLRPFFRLNTGYFRADYESGVFDELDNNAMILAPEFGINYPILDKIKIQAGIGYHLTSGTGDSGPGTLYPFFTELTLLWDLTK